MLFAPVSLQGFHDVRFAGTNPLIAQLGQLDRIALTREDGTKNLLAGLADDVGNDVI